jgi:hypothetical protein
VVDLALETIDGMEQLPDDARAHQEEEVRALLDELDTDQARMGELHGWLQRAAGTGELRYQVLARLMGVEAPAEQVEELTGPEITRRLETQGYAKEGPKFSDQLEDASRDETVFTYDGQTFSDAAQNRGRNRYRTTELRGLRELSGFVNGFISKSARHQNEVGFRAGRDGAKSIRDNLTYMGAEELDEGTSGLAAYLNEYLTSDSGNQLCLITDSSLPEHHRPGRGILKSDDFIKGEVLEQMQKLGLPPEAMDRIITDPRQMNGDPSQWKAVCLEDWVVSGRQMRAKIGTVLSMVDSKYRDTIEVNVLTAPPHIIDEGLSVGTKTVPVRAYYRAHAAAAEDSEGVRAHITGTHATVNFGFSVQIERMQKMLNDIRARDQRPVQMPAAASVYRPYWN